MSLAIFLALALDGAAQQPGRAIQPPVILDVVVTDAQGRTVTTLQASDFAVDEQGTPRRVVAARFVKNVLPIPSPADAAPVQSADDERREAAEPGVRLFAIFLDEFHVTSGPGADRTRDALIRFVREALSPHDLLVVLKPLDSLLTIRLTRDRESALRALETFQGRKGDYTPRTTFEQKYLAATPARVDAARAQIASSALLALASHLGSLGPMRKTLIVLSEGFECTARRRGEVLLPTLDTAVIVANRARVSIYPIDPASAPPGAVRPATQAAGSAPTACESFWSLASETSGQAVLTRAQLDPGLQQALSDSSGYYELTLAPAVQPNDGRFHPVKVQIGKTGLAVRARKGYWASLPERPPTTSAAAQGGAARLDLVRRISPTIRPWFGMTPAPNGATRVSFVWEPSPRVPGERNPPPRPARVALKVSKPDGTAVFDGVVLPAGDSFGDRGSRSRAVFELPPGRLKIQMAIQDLSSKVLDTDVRDLDVRGFTGPIAFGTPEVLRARNAREFRELAADLDAIPTAFRQFSRREHLLVRLRLHRADANSPATVTARLGSALGGSMRELAVTPVAGGSVYQVDLPLSGLAAGSYTLELRGSSGDGQVRDTLPIAVTP
jgi:VWFA-related protein